MYCDTFDEESYYPQVGRKSSSSGFQSIYWRCILLFFASSKRHNPEARHRLFTNATTIPAVDGFDTGGLLEELGVEVVVMPMAYSPPKGYHSAWRSVFYILDALKYTAKHAQPDDDFLFTDMDCLFVRPVDDLHQAIRQYGLVVYDPEFDENKDTNGLTRNQMATLYEELGVSTATLGIPISYGAELIGMSAETLYKIEKEIDPVWQWTLQRFSSRLPKFNTEEHLLSYIYYRLGYYGGEGNRFTSRIWTGWKHKTTKPSDFDLTVWHVPAEKKYGLRRLFGQLRDNKSKFWNVEPGIQFARYASSYLGIPRPNPIKSTLDVYDALRYKLTKDYV